MFTIPGLNVKADTLDALLAGIGYRLRMLADGNHPEFAKLIAGRQVTIQFTSQSSSVARYYVFDDGDVSQHSGRANNPDLSIAFADSATGVRLLTQGDAAAFMSAIQDKQVNMDGDYSLLMWFNKIAKHIVPSIPEHYQPYLKKAKPYAYKTQRFAKHWWGLAKHKMNK